jgi:peptidoglycan/LPS O-acetylase OafA/YrhL
MGGALGWLARDRLGFEPSGEIAALAAAVLAVAALPGAADIMVVPIFTWVVLVFAGDSGPVSRLLHHPFPQMLGRVSYSIYMVHYVAGLSIMTSLVLLTPLTKELDGIATIVAPWWVTEPVTISYLALVVLVSRFTFEWIELPGRRLSTPRNESLPIAW